jgi:hypothetical protein
MDPDQTARMRRLVWIHAGRKPIMLIFVVAQLKLLFRDQSINSHSLNLSSAAVLNVNLRLMAYKPPRMFM